MLTILRHNILNASHRTIKTVCGHGSNRRNICISIRRQAQLPQLSPYDVNMILKENEFMYVIPENQNSTIHSYESNQVASNKPCEDWRTEGSFLHKRGFICGIFDGHAGPACAQVISKRLLRYIAASLIDRNILKEQIEKGCDSQSFLKCHNDNVDFVKDIKNIYEGSFNNYINFLANEKLLDVSSTIENAFISLDNDLSQEALNNTNMKTMAVAMSGAVACVAHIEGLDIHLASTGDCTAVLGTICTESGNWISKKLNQEHNTDNQQEVQRIIMEHPKESDTVIRNDRLLSQLAPLRSMGDFRYKWSNEIMEKYVVPVFGEQAVPPHYYTPPYLSAKPDVTHHRLTVNDKFLVIGSDGLFDFLTPSQVVNLVGDHLNSKKCLEPIKLPAAEDVTLQTISDILAERKAGRTRKPSDQNSATHLIRHALGSTDYGIEHSKIAYYLSLPQDVVRLYRDDITITVIYFNTDCINDLNSQQT